MLAVEPETGIYHQHLITLIQRKILLFFQFRASDIGEFDRLGMKCIFIFFNADVDVNKFSNNHLSFYQHERKVF